MDAGTPLAARHRCTTGTSPLGAKFAEFGGWSMPLEYAGRACSRSTPRCARRSGIFDVSHLGKAIVRGPGAAAFVNAALSNDLGRIAPGQGAVHAVLRRRDRRRRRRPDRLPARRRRTCCLVPNAANTAEVVRRLRRRGARRASRSPTSTATYAVLAVQGPRSDEVLDAVGLPTGHDYMSLRRGRRSTGAGVVVCRTGYTGERGYELVVPRTTRAGALWDALLAAGEPLGHAAVRPRRPRHPAHRDGLPAARPGHLASTSRPVQARLGWAVGWNKPAFWGRDALRRREGGRARAAAARPGRHRPRHPAARHERAARPPTCPSGEITSGTFSPTLRKGIGARAGRPPVERGRRGAASTSAAGARCSP